jgi:DNA repair exonuclease SbcCD ATPase subunit
MSDILKDLNEQKANFEAQLATLQPDTAEYRAVQDEINIVTNKIAEQEYAMKQRQETIEEKVHSDSVPFAVAGVDFTKLPAELITVIELVVKADRRRILAEHAVELEQVEQEAEKAKVALNELGTKFDELKEDYHKQYLANADFQQKVMILTNERDEALKLRDNAATQIDEKNAEIERLQSQIDDYQKAKVFGEREAQNVIETKPEEVTELNDAIQKLYVRFENWGSINKVVKEDGSFELVKTEDLQNNWTQVTPPQVIGGSNDAGTFQNDTTAEPQDAGSDTPTTIKNVGDTSDSFPQDANGSNPVEGQPSNSELAPKTVEERLAALEVAVFGKAEGAAA